jgi:hypothetical protein
MAAVKSCLMLLMPDLCPMDDALWQWADELDHDAWIEGLKRTMCPDAVDDAAAFVMDYVGYRAGDETSQIDGDADTDGRSQFLAKRLGSVTSHATPKEDGGRAKRAATPPSGDVVAGAEVYGTPMDDTTPAGSPVTAQEAMAEPESLETMFSAKVHQVIPLGGTT